jgi:hypothetical protein
MVVLASLFGACKGRPRGDRDHAAASILGHGFIDSFGVIVVYLGWDS